MKKQILKEIVCLLLSIYIILPLISSVYGATFTSYWQRNNSKNIIIYQGQQEIAVYKITAFVVATVRVTTSITSVPAYVNPPTNAFSFTGGTEQTWVSNWTVTNQGVTTQTSGTITFTLKDDFGNVLDIQILNFILEKPDVPPPLDDVIINNDNSMFYYMTIGGIGLIVLIAIVVIKKRK